MLKKIIDIGINTATITRYSQSHLLREESVMEHTGFVSMFCLIVSELMPEVDVTILLRKAIVHDMEESIVGDISRVTKYANADINREINLIEKVAMRDISFDLLGTVKLYNYWLLAKDGTIEGRIVRIADAISVLLKIYEESVILNNRAITNHINSLSNYFNDMRNNEENTVLHDLLEEAMIICAEIKRL